MKQGYYVSVKYDDETTDMIATSSNAKTNLVNMLTTNMWIRCEDSGRYFNMNKVKTFQVQEADQ